MDLLAHPPCCRAEGTAGYPRRHHRAARVTCARAAILHRFNRLALQKTDKRMQFPKFMDSPVPTKYSALLDLLGSYEGIVVAFSGGVDSLLLLHASVEALGSDRVEAVIGVAPTLPKEELKEARAFSEKLGVRLHEIETDVMEFEPFTRNPPERCYHCRIRLSEVLDSVALGGRTVMDGANADDLLDYRPGIKAADEHSVIHPLIITDFTKKDIRDTLRTLGYPAEVYDRPSSPCLSSRIPYGEEITHAKLDRVERAERHLKSMGFRELRVRHVAIAGKPAAVVEIAGSEMVKMGTGVREEIIAQLKSMGFSRIFLDLEGFRSGKMNDLIDASGGKEESSIDATIKGSENDTGEEGPGQ